jgi:hypothetical protein
MSLFERDDYQWRETFFVLFDEAHRPSASEVKKSLESLNSRLQVSDLCADPEGAFESLTVFSPDDFAAMDITCITGEEVREQIPELVEQLRTNVVSDDERKALKALSKCTARIDVFHFEQQTSDETEDEGEFMDPGGLLLVLDRLGQLCHGIVVDPQSSSLL